MLSFPLILFLLALTLAAWFLLESMRVRERVLRTGRSYCREFGLQLLDDTVQHDGLALARDDRGRWRLVRHFRFEYSTDGSSREPGRIMTLGGRVQRIDLADQTILH